MGNRLAWVGGVIIALLIGTALLAPLLAPYDPMAIDLTGELEGPRLGHPLGQDKLGRDILLPPCAAAIRCVHGHDFALAPPPQGSR